MRHLATAPWLLALLAVGLTDLCVDRLLKPLFHRPRPVDTLLQVRALVELRRVTHRDGWLLVLDSPVYRSRPDGEAMVAQGRGSIINISSVADLLGSDAEVELAAVIDGRQDAVDRALKALSLQYPGYAESIEARQLERAAIRFEAAEYERRLQEGIISREVYNDLRQQLVERRSAISRRPPLDLGLELAGMISRVSLFASLDRQTIAEVGKQLRALVALPGEKIVAIGGAPDAMYFIAAGEVTVKAPTYEVTLKEGDFFGEMAPLERRRHKHDVVAKTNCRVYVLDSQALARLGRRHPEIMQRIRKVAEARQAADAAPDDDHIATPAQLHGSFCTGQNCIRDLTLQEARIQVASGIAYVRICRERARAQLKQGGVSWDETGSDFWSLVKMQHNLPSVPKTYIPKLRPSSWSEFKAGVLKEHPEYGSSSIFSNAEDIGAAAG
jgi:hypothetical protein